MLLLTNKNKVKLANGDQVPVGDLRIGHEVKGSKQTNKVVGVKHTLQHESLWALDDAITLTGTQLLMDEFGSWMAIAALASQEHYPFTVEQLRQETALAGEDSPFYIDKLEGVDEGDSKLVCVELELDGDHTFFCNGFLLHNKGGGSSGGGTTIQKSEPPEYLAPYLKDIAKKAQTAYGEVPQGGFSGQLIAAPTANQEQSLVQQEQVANSLNGFGQNTLDSAQQQTDRVNSGYYTDPANTQFQQTNVGTQEAVNSYLQPVLDNLNNNVIPGVQSQAIQQGAYGGARGDIELAQQINDNYTREANSIASQIGYGEAVRQDDQRFQDYTQGREMLPQLQQNELSAILANPDLYSAGAQQMLTPSSILGQVGAAEQLQNQDVLDEAYQQYILETQMPFAGLDQYAGLVSGTGYGGTSTATSNTPQSSKAAGAISGALGGGLGAYGLSQMAGMSALGGLPGIGAGAILGGLMGVI